MINYRGLQKYKPRFIPVIGLLSLFMLVAVVGAGIYLTSNDSSPKPSTETQDPSLLNQPKPTDDPNPTSTFDIEKFYNSLRYGMEPDEVIELAGKQPDDCASTGSEPPSVSCFWFSGGKTVNVSYGNKDAVQAIKKTGF